MVIDTDVFSADLVPTSRLAQRYAPLITGRPAFISFQTATELRYGAIRRGWGEARMLKLDSKIQRAEVVHGRDVTVSDERDWAVSDRRDAASF
jgi:hypothetical protein